MKFFALLLLIVTSTAFAEEILLASFPENEIEKANTVRSKFIIDFDRGEVSTEVVYEREMNYCSGYGNDYGCTSAWRTIKVVKARIENMNLVDDKLIFDGATGPVLCGVVKFGRIFRNVRNIFINGNCLVRSQRSHGTVEISLKTK